jgi:hypothetical protein
VPGEESLLFIYKSQASTAFSRGGLPPCVAEAFVPEHFYNSGG